MNLATSAKLQKLMLTVGAVGATAAIAGLGTFATFTSSTPAQSQDVATGIVKVQLGSANRLIVNASGLAAGDTVQRAIDLQDISTIATNGVTLSTSATVSSILTTDTTDGLQMTVTKCSVPWTETGTAPAYIYTCSGTTSVVLDSRPVVGSNVALSNLAAGATSHLVVKLTLPLTAGNSFQDKTSTLSYSFSAAQSTTSQSQ